MKSAEASVFEALQVLGATWKPHFPIKQGAHTCTYIQIFSLNKPRFTLLNTHADTVSAT